MVARSNQNWEHHKQDVHQLLMKYGEDNANAFLNLYKSRFDQFNRSFISYKLGIKLMDDREYCKKIGSIVYLLVGKRGTGKSQTMKNISYFHDPMAIVEKPWSTDIKYIKDRIISWGEGSGRAIFLDEPEAGHHWRSKLGREFTKFISVMRPSGVYLGICTTTLRHIPQDIIENTDRIIFLPSHRLNYGYYYDDDYPDYIVEEIKNRWVTKGLSFKTFLQPDIKRYGVVFDKILPDPYPEKFTQEYKADRWNILNIVGKRIDELHADQEGGEQRPMHYERDRMITKLREKGLKNTEIAEIAGITPERVSQLLGKILNDK